MYFSVLTIRWYL